MCLARAVVVPASIRSIWLVLFSFVLGFSYFFGCCLGICYIFSRSCWRCCCLLLTDPARTHRNLSVCVSTPIIIRMIGFLAKIEWHLGCVVRFTCVYIPTTQHVGMDTIIGGTQFLFRFQFVSACSQCVFSVLKLKIGVYGEPAASMTVNGNVYIVFRFSLYFSLGYLRLWFMSCEYFITKWIWIWNEWVLASLTAF